MIRTIVAVLCVVPLFSQACEGPEGSHAVGNGIYLDLPELIPLSEPFDVALRVCDVDLIGSITVDAGMPAHKHGMNYQPEMLVEGDGVLRARGLVFHMPGVWQIVVQGPEGPIGTLDVTVK